MSKTAGRIVVVLVAFVLMSANLTACGGVDRTVDRAISEINTALATFTGQSDAWRAA